MTLFVDFLLLISIICVFILSFYVYSLKSNFKAKESEIDSIKAQFAQDSSSCLSREKTLHETISKLQDTLNKEQILIQNREDNIKLQEVAYKETLSSLTTSLNEEKESKKKILSQKKSSEVRIGNIAEKLAPFLDDFEFDPEKCIFLGQPIDYISFGEDEITFIEVKSGKSQLNSKQRHIRDLVKAKHISWKEFRII